MHFENLNLIDPLLRAVRSEGYTHPTPIQLQSIPHILAGKDLLGCAQTGTGKTAAFALPLLQRLAAAGVGRTGPIRVLVLSPTRELATQICDSFATYGKHLGLTQTVIFGGVGQEPQVRALRRGVDILVATPGRLLDLMSQRLISFTGLETLVLDEADRMLDMGFIHDVRRIINSLPKKRQTLFFSATMPPDIARLASDILNDPVRVEVTPTASTVEKIDQAVYFVSKNDKRALLEHLLRDNAVTRALVFTRTKHGANRVAEQLTRALIRAEAIHGNKAQGARERALANFKSGATRVLVATDIAARGIDVEGISHVINFDLPNISESYVHRIGRTGRAGASGIALSLCDSGERTFLEDVQRLIRMQIPVIADHPFPMSAQAMASQPFAGARPRQDRDGGAGQGRAGRRQDDRRPPSQGFRSLASNGGHPRGGLSSAAPSGAAPRGTDLPTRPSLGGLKPAGARRSFRPRTSR